MLKESLATYRLERKAFISSLKLFFDIDFYELDVEERNAWLHTYLLYKREFMDNMNAFLDENGMLCKKH